MIEAFSFERARFDDLLRRVGKTWQDGLTDFMPASDADHLQTAFRHASPFIHRWGGYDQADRVRLLARAHDASPQADDYQMVVLAYRTQDPSFQADHRDFLGALMAFGFDRAKTGDIIAYDQGCDVLCDRDFAGFFRTQALQVRGTSMTLDILDIHGWEAPVKRFLEKTLSVESLRLDGVLARAFDMSRRQAKEAIRQGHVQVDQRQTTRFDQLLAPGMTFSCRGRGKARLLEVLGQSRKGKLRVQIGIYQ